MHPWDFGDNWVSHRTWSDEKPAEATARILFEAMGGKGGVVHLGSIDLSMEGTISVCAVVFGFTFLALGGTLFSQAWIAIPLTLLLGTLLGFLNGMVHVVLCTPSFMASLAMGFVGTGLSVLMTSGEKIFVESDAFRSLLTARFFGFPISATWRCSFCWWPGSSSPTRGWGETSMPLAGARSLPMPRV